MAKASFLWGNSDFLKAVSKPRLTPTSARASGRTRRGDIGMCVHCAFTNCPATRAWPRGQHAAYDALHASRLLGGPISRPAPRASSASRAPCTGRRPHSQLRGHARGEDLSLCCLLAISWRVLMSQAESARRLTLDEKQQRWLVTTPCETWASNTPHASSQFLTPVLCSSGSSFPAWSHGPRRSW